MKSRLTVSIVTYHTDIDELDRCLQSLRSPVVEQIYIVDNSRQAYISDYCRAKEGVEYIGRLGLMVL